MSEFLKEYYKGCSYKKGDKLRIRQGARDPWTAELVDGVFYVLEQSALAPHRYYVVGEQKNPATPADRFLKTEINGHDYELAK